MHKARIFRGLDGPTERGCGKTFILCAPLRYAHACGSKGVLFSNDLRHSWSCALSKDFAEIEFFCSLWSRALVQNLFL